MTSANRWAVKSNRIIDGTNGPVLNDGVVVVEGNRIVSVGPQSTTVLPRGVNAFDAGDRTIMPGMIDAHVHMLSTGGNSGGDESRAMNDQQATLQGAKNSLLALKSGLTTVRDCGDRNYLS